MDMHFHFVGFLDIEMVQVYEIPTMAVDGLAWYWPR